MNLKTLLSNLLLFGALISCAKLPAEEKKKSENKSEVAYFDFKDLSGSFLIKREIKIQDKKLYIRRTLFETTKSEFEPLEKTITVSEIGSVKIAKKNYPVLRPFASQFEVWLDKKKHFVQSKINKKEKSLELFFDDDQNRYPPKRKFKFPKSMVFCYFSQIPECIAHTGFLQQSTKVKKGEMPIYIIWDSYPYILEQYVNMEGEVFSSAKFAFAEEEKEGYKFALESEKHVIVYHFDKSYNFQKMFWIAQGMSMVRR